MLLSVRNTILYSVIADNKEKAKHCNVSSCSTNGHNLTVPLFNPEPVGVRGQEPSPVDCASVSSCSC